MPLEITLAVVLFDTWRNIKKSKLNLPILVFIWLLYNIFKPAINFYLKNKLR